MELEEATSEFIVAAISSCQVVGLRQIVEAVGQNQISPTAIYCDSSSVANC